MSRIKTGLLAFALATAPFSTSSLAGPPDADGLKKDSSVQKRIAFHVIGLMKTKSGAT